MRDKLKIKKEFDILNNTILLRDGLDAAKLWEARYKSVLDNSPQKGIKIVSLLGAGAKGAIFSVLYNNQPAALKIYAYPEEIIQIKALSFWPLISPQIYTQPFPEAVLMEKIGVGDKYQPKSNQQEVEEIIFVLNYMKQNSPINIPDKAVKLKLHFDQRIKRAEERNSVHHLFDPESVARVNQLWSKYLSNFSEDNQIVHGDFSHGNILAGGKQKPIVIDPRTFLWGDKHVDLGKWILARRHGHDIKNGIKLFSNDDWDGKALLFWIMLQAYDDSIAIATLKAKDPRIKDYKNVVLNLLKYSQESQF